MWYQRSKAQFMVHGDNNTQYIHVIVVTLQCRMAAARWRARRSSAARAVHWWWLADGSRGGVAVGRFQ